METTFQSNFTELNSDSSSSSGLKLFSKLLVGSVFFLIFAGSMVTSHDAGLSVPDWPTTYGQNMFLFPPSKWQGGIFYEHVHRLIASGIGFLTLILAVWVGRVERRRWVRMLAFSSLALVVLQGVLGGLTVLFLLPAPISIAHGVIAQTFFVITIIIAYSQSDEFRAVRAKTNNSSALFKTALFCAGCVYIQLVLGAIMRHTESGLAIPDFPKMGNSWWPTFDAAMLEFINSYRLSIGFAPVTLGQVFAHLIHRTGAIVVLLAFVLLNLKALKVWKSSLVTRRTVLFIDQIVLVQIALGIFTVLSIRHPIITSMHVLVGALLLGMSVLLSLKTYQFK